MPRNIEEVSGVDADMEDAGVVRVLGISGSLRSASTNSALVRAIDQLKARPLPGIGRSQLARRAQGKIQTMSSMLNCPCSPARTDPVSIVALAGEA